MGKIKRNVAFLLLAFLLLVLSSSAWALFPCNPGDSAASCCHADSGLNGYSWDLGLCDTLHVVPWPKIDTCFIDSGVSGCDTICINNPGKYFPCFLYLNLFVTHDSNTFWWQEYKKWVQDSIISFVLPLAWTHTNPTAYCSLSTSWNRNTMDWENSRFPRSIWRHFHPSRLDSNRMAWLAEQSQGLEWSATVNMTSDSSWYHYSGGRDSAFVPPYIWMTLLPVQQTSRKWWEGGRTLLATFTFRIADTMHICIDTTFWPPSSRLKYTRHDVKSYVPRDNLPLCIWVHPPPLVVTSPNGGESWCEESTHNITWLSEDFTNDVKIEYSTNRGGDWIVITSCTENDGVYSWRVPNTPSTRCLVKISDASGGDPYAESEDCFTIAEQLLGVTSPNGGQTLIVDSTHEITWTGACVESVKIEYSTNAGFSWFSVVDTTPSDGRYSWQVPDTPSDSCRVRICDIDGAPCDTSDSNFFIVTPDFTIDAYPDTQYVCAGADTNYYVRLTPWYGFSSPCTLSVSNLPPGATGVFDEPIMVYPYADTLTLTIATADTTPGNEYTIAILGTEMTKGKKGMEHSTQVILVVTSIEVTSPNGGEKWCVGKVAGVTWRSEGFSGPFVKIDYSTNAGTCWLPVADSTPRNVSYLWSIPDTPSDSCLIRVSGPQEGDPYDQSNDFFTIFLAGDANADRTVDASDLVYLVNYLFVKGPAPIHFEAGDVNLDGVIDAGDLIYLLNYLFIHGPAPLCWMDSMMLKH
jgi:hypothetical protein